MSVEPARSGAMVTVECWPGEGEEENGAAFASVEGTMEIRFECLFEGKKLFQVLRTESEQVIFTGTGAQCRRFLEVYQEKVARARPRDRRVSRPQGALLLRG